MPAMSSGLQLPPRCIPAPSSISPQAQAVLAAAATNAMAWAGYPEAYDTEGWLNYARVANQNMLSMLEAVSSQLPWLATEEIATGGCTTYRVGSPDGQTADERIFFHLHGGALIAGGGPLCAMSARLQSFAMAATVYAPDYRMPPQCKHPTPLDDCIDAYRAVIERHDPGMVVVHGASAGGNLAAALLLRAREAGLPLPAGLILETPELDLTESGDTFETLALIDCILQRRLGPINRLYAGDHDLAHPHLSPLFGDVGEFPPTLLTAGTRDMFLSNAVRMHHRLRAAGRIAELLVYEAMPHGGFFGAPEDDSLRRDVRSFAERCWNSGS
jgi:epsilon-lactone hydrolase